MNQINPLSRSAESRSPSATAQAQGIELRQSRVTLPCGVQTLRIDIRLSCSRFVFEIGCYPGYTGGGKDEDGLKPRLKDGESTVTCIEEVSQQVREVWPPLPAVERRVNGQVVATPYLPENALAHRLERAFYAVEPMMHHLANLRGKYMADTSRLIDKPLIQHIKTLLANY